MPKNKKAQSTVKDLMIIAIFIFSLSSFTLSVYDHHQITNQNQNKNPTGYFMFHIPHWLHGHNSKHNNMEMPTKMFHPKPYKYNGPLTQQQVVEQTPAYHILKDIYTIINGKYYPIATKEGYINGSLIDLSTLTNKLSKEFVRKSGDVINGDLNMNNHDIENVNEIDVKRLCLNGKCTTIWPTSTETYNNLALYRHVNGITNYAYLVTDGNPNTYGFSCTYGSHYPDCPVCSGFSKFGCTLENTRDKIYRYTLDLGRSVSVAYIYVKAQGYICGCSITGSCGTESVTISVQVSQNGINWVTADEGEKQSSNCRDSYTYEKFILSPIPNFRYIRVVIHDHASYNIGSAYTYTLGRLYEIGVWEIPLKLK